ncbi:MAG: aminotransferase class I/II-fold pyridoxal phosphate-dependent enzyme [Pseudomonadota bacterium]
MRPQEKLTGRDHGGGIDAAIEVYGGDRQSWVDLSTGINPVPYPFSIPEQMSWTDLPDLDAVTRTEMAVRAHWNIPDRAQLCLVPGLSIAIAQLPHIIEGQRVSVVEPTYNEYRASFEAAGWRVSSSNSDVHIVVSPNNPTGTWAEASLVTRSGILILDESFADTVPDRSLSEHAENPGVLILKGIGKFWGLAGLRFGAVFGDAELVSRLKLRLGPWAVSGPALEIARQALSDISWATTTRQSLSRKAGRLDDLMAPLKMGPARGTSLFRLYSVADAVALQHALASDHIWTRTFPNNEHLIRLGIPRDDASFARVSDAVDRFLS